MSCPACSRLVYRFAPDSIYCTRCAPKVSEVKVICQNCGRTDYPYIRDPIHCRPCNSSTTWRQAWRKAMPKTIVCVMCGLTKASWKKKECLCQACDTKRRIGAVKCTVNGCGNRIINKGLQLCKRHDAERVAAPLLRKYLENYSSPFPQNEQYMAELAATINWQNVEKGTARIVEYHVSRFRAIGKLLKTKELPEVLTWEAIENVLPPLGKKRRTTTKFIRSALFDLGHLFAERGLLPEWNLYLAERRLGQAVQKAPSHFLEPVQSFKKWAEGGMLNPKLQFLPMELDILASTSKTIHDTIKSISSFLTWCMGRGVVSLEVVDSTLIADYQRSLCWLYECKVCHRRFSFEPAKSIERCANPECNAAHSYVRERRISRSFLKAQTSHLRMFFDWAELHGFIRRNPLTGEVCRITSRTVTSIDQRGNRLEVGHAIRRYDDRVIEKLCTYIVSPEADPEEAIILYLIIFHLCTVKELCHLRVPSHISPESNQTQLYKAQDYEYLLLPKSVRTRGRRLPTRFDPKLVFPRKALSWLVPLLERYYEKRKEVVSAEHHEYLLAVKWRARHNTPVSAMYVRRIIRRASLRVLTNGEVCASRLRRTAAAVFAQRSRRRSAVLTTLGYTAESATRFNYLETLTLPLKITIQSNDRRM